MNPEICFLKEDGQARTSSIFDPLLSILFQALEESAENVCIIYSRVTPGCISATYGNAHGKFPLSVEPNFSPADVFVRLRIIAGMSIVAEGCQTGETQLRFKSQNFKVLVEINSEETRETIGLKFL